MVRHRVKRLIKESYRLNENKFDRGLDLVVVARPGAREKSFFEIESALLHLGKYHNILNGICRENRKEGENEVFIN